MPTNENVNQNYNCQLVAGEVVTVTIGETTVFSYTVPEGRVTQFNCQTQERGV